MQDFLLEYLITAQLDIKALKSQLKQLKTALGGADIDLIDDKKVKSEVKNVIKELDKIDNEFEDLEKSSKKFSKEAVKSFDNVGESAKDLGDGFGNLKGVFAAVGVGLIAAGMTNLASETIKAQRAISQLTDLSGDELNNMTAQFQAISDVFETDFNENVIAANTLMKEYGLSGEEAGRIIEDAYLAGGDASGELIAQLKEYPAFFREAGFAAEEMTAFFISGTKEGIFSDKSADVVKEFNLRIRELTPTTRDALKLIGMSGEEIAKQLANGTKSVKDIMFEVSNRLKDFGDNSTQVGTVLADVFGGPGEDAGIRYIKMIGDMDLSMQDLTNSTDPYVLLQQEQLKSQQSMNIAIGSLTQKLLPALVAGTQIAANVIGFVAENMDIMAIGIGTIAVALLAYNANAILAAYSTWSLSAALKSTGIPLLITAIGLLVAGVIYAYKNFDSFRAVVDAVGESISDAVSWLGDFLGISDETNESIKEQSGELENLEKKYFDLALGIEATNTSLEKMAPLAEGATSKLKQLADELERVESETENFGESYGVLAYQLKEADLGSRATLKNYQKQIADAFKAGELTQTGVIELGKLISQATEIDIPDLSPSINDNVIKPIDDIKKPIKTTKTAIKSLSQQLNDLKAEYLKTADSIKKAKLLEQILSVINEINSQDTGKILLEIAIDEAQTVTNLEGGIKAIGNDIGVLDIPVDMKLPEIFQKLGEQQPNIEIPLVYSLPKGEEEGLGFYDSLINEVTSYLDFSLTAQDDLLEAEIDWQQAKTDIQRDAALDRIKLAEDELDKNKELGMLAISAGRRISAILEDDSKTDSEKAIALAIDTAEKLIAMYSVEILAKFSTLGPWGTAAGIAAIAAVSAYLASQKSKIGAEEGVVGLTSAYSKPPGATDTIDAKLALGETVITKAGTLAPANSELLEFINETGGSFLNFPGLRNMLDSNQVNIANPQDNSQILTQINSNILVVNDSINDISGRVHILENDIWKANKNQVIKRAKRRVY